MIINAANRHLSPYINQHKNSNFIDKDIYLLPTNLDIFKLVDIDIKTKKLHEYIPKEILEKIYAKEVILGIDLSTEALYRHIDIIYDKLVIENNLSETSLLLISSSTDIFQKIKEKAISSNKLLCLFEYFNYFEYASHLILTQELPIDYVSPLTKLKFSKKYINFNGTWRHHRIALLSSLYAKNLLDLGYNSFSKTYNYYNSNLEDIIFDPIKKIASVNTGIEGRLYFNAEINNQIDDLWEVWIEQTKSKFQSNDINDLLAHGYDVYKKIPLIVDKTDYQKRKDFPLNTIVSKGSYINLAHYYHKTYFSVVTETLFFNNNANFITEKTFKPVIFKHPFIILSTPHILKHFRQLGYKTFHPYINESYDDEIDDSKRFLMILNEVERLCNLKESDLENFKQNLLEITNYNYSILYNKSH